MARMLLRGQDHGVLSTVSSEVSGYPFGSPIPYLLTNDGKLVVHVTFIPRRSDSMQVNPPVSLTVVAKSESGRHGLGRVTVVGDAMRVPRRSLPAVQERYFKRFSEACELGARTFLFYWIKPRRIRCVSDCGEVCWIAPKNWSDADAPTYV